MFKKSFLKKENGATPLGKGSIKKKKKWENSHLVVGPPPPLKAGKQFFFKIMYMGSKKCFNAKIFFFGGVNGKK